MNEVTQILKENKIKWRPDISELKKKFGEFLDKLEKKLNKDHQIEK